MATILKRNGRRTIQFVGGRTFAELKISRQFLHLGARINDVGVFPKNYRLGHYD